ncbi:helix-turn-helix transcriptional regulator [Citrobacter amalonaticus]|uniref:Helix-turn-helix transcriptional regulator n=1 Tax=Citrobacter amalonaticus TaxID=35703 RepID=A0A2S4RV14_CITAM|nr:response regulator transcription factor [Citrobacter amalonaticus]POT55536.1 helix-turn-helix transcriptional regulator [Citrobacter amalonaticus]POT73747.1 helix-turn-helix transcriptional regulator [Citrobacter amalonaticus]POU63972.1 helix-turn-helix transcriptional regulator [Citrobacter amalonaticus]POV03605.1 helix-turn-helix transcriptional regulator [Citrobacter amalonaticus]
MQIVMFDRQSIFIHGMKISLQQRIPGVSIRGVSQADELWQKLEENPEALVMLDGDMDGEFCRWLLQKTVQQFSQVKVLITATDCSKKWLQEMTQLRVLAIVPRDSSAETFALALNSLAMGMMFLPGQWLSAPDSEPRSIKALSARQREILTMLAAGESNKEIGRALNISTGTVKAHLESLYRRLDVKNRTQAAMMLSDAH